MRFLRPGAFIRCYGLIILSSLALALLAGGCAPTRSADGAPVAQTTSSPNEAQATSLPAGSQPVGSPTSARPPSSPTPADTPTLPAAPVLPTPIPTAIPSPTPTPSPTPDRTIQCSQRMPDDGLLAIVTLTYGLSRDYEPAGLVDLSNYLPKEVTLGYPTQLRRLAIGPLVNMINDMQAEGLHPMIISGYRSYSAQAIARQKWADKEPDRVNILSAPPGFSEHQLGTVIDFGSPELAEIVGDENIEFHTYFYKTSEGAWLLANAHRYGFTLSYPFEATEVTGFFYEPWHYRYVGVEMATFLLEQGTSLTEYQLATEPPPCIPDEP